MRIANLNGRSTLLTERGSIDIERASGGRFGPDPASVFDAWDDFACWATTLPPETGTQPWEPGQLRAPSPTPRQVFAVGLNYAPHAEEAGLDLPSSPLVFTKFPSCIVGPYTDLELPPGQVDWEVELVAVIGRPTYRITAADAWAHIAGLTVGQDFSERVVQTLGTAPQFSVGKSFPGFGPTGPWLTTLDEFPDPDNIELCCAINGETVQQGRTSELIFSVPTVLEWLSDKVRLFPGDLVFTGTPSGTGSGRQPPRFLQPGDVVTTEVVGIGALRNTCVVRPG